MAAEMIVNEYYNLEEALEAVTRHELLTNTKFSVYKCSKNFGYNDLDSAKRVFWADQASVKIGRQEFTGIPFVVVGHKQYDCKFGKDRKSKMKAERMQKKDEKEHLYPKGKKFLESKTKKLGCPAHCTLREICRFPSYKIEEEKGLVRRTKQEDLCVCLRRGDNVPYVKDFIAVLAGEEDHVGHPVGQSAIVPEPSEYAIHDKYSDQNLDPFGEKSSVLQDNRTKAFKRKTLNSALNKNKPAQRSKRRKLDETVVTGGDKMHVNGRSFLRIRGGCDVFSTEDWNPNDTSLFCPGKNDVYVNLHKYDQITTAVQAATDDGGNLHNLVSGHLLHLWRYDQIQRKQFISQSFLFTNEQEFMRVQSFLQHI